MLELRQVSKVYPHQDGAVAALQEVSLDVAAGEFVAVRGPSGSGKTTLLLACGALLCPDSGEVRLDGQDPYAVTPNQRALLRARKLGFVFQQFHLVPYLTVRENVLAPSLAAPSGAAAGRAESLLARFGLLERAGHRPADLSTGERQRVALARALLNEPGLILADEPTGNLDEANAGIVLGHLVAFADAGGAVLLVTHSAEAAQWAQRMVHLEGGNLRTEPGHA